MSKARNLSDFISEAAIDATEIGPNAVTTDKVADQAVTPAKLHNTLDLSSKTVTLPTDGISGNSIHGGVISGFASTGIDDNASGTAVTINSSGNVGIGTANPNQKLHIYGDTPQILLETSDSRGEAWSIRSTNGAPSNTGTLSFRDEAGNGWFDLAQNEGAPITRFYSGASSERMVIRNDGKVGIGTSSPDAKLDIEGNFESEYALKFTNTFGAGRVSGFRSHGGNGESLSLYHDGDRRQTWDSNGSVTFENGDGNDQLYIGATGNVGIGTNSPPNLLTVDANAAATTSDSISVRNRGISATGHTVGLRFQYNAAVPSAIRTVNTNISSGAGRLGLFTSPDGTAGNLDERLSILSNGNTGIRSSNPQATLEVYGFIRAGKNGARLNASVHSYSTRYNSLRAPENLYTGITNYEQHEDSSAASDWLTESGQRDNAYVILDLGDSKSINRAVIYNQNEYQDSKREVKRFILQGTNDVNNANSWVTVLDDVMGKSGAHEPNPGYSFRIPAGNQTSVKNDPVDDEEAVSYRYWKFIMKDFWGSDAYGGLMEIELYEYAVSSDSRQDEISASSMVATDVYAQTLAATGDINLIGQAQVNYNYHPVPSTMAPHSIPGLSSYLDMQHSYRYPRSGSSVDRYTLADLGNEPMSWTLRNQNAANLTNAHMVNNINGVVDGRYSMKTGSNAAGGGVAATNQDRYHMMTYNGPVTFVWIAMRGNGGGINSNESLLTQNTNASSYGYQIIRHYPNNAETYSYAVQSQNISYPSGYSTAAASQKWYLIAHQYWDENQQSITFFDNNYPNGNQQTSTANYDWRWNANANTRRLVLGGSEWGSFGEAWGQGSSSSSMYGAIGAFMYYKNSLSTYDLKTIFDYYRNHYDMG